MSEDDHNIPASPENWSDDEPQPYADTPLPYVEQPSSSSHEQPTHTVQQPAPLPEEARLAATYQLGNVIKRYKSDSTAFTTDDFPSSAPLTRVPSHPGIGIVNVFAPMMFIATLGIWVLTGTPPWLMILMCLLILAPWLGNVIGRLPSDVIVGLQNPAFYLCSNGLMITRRRRVQALRWEQIQAVQRCRTYHVLRPDYILYPNEGKPVTLTWSLVGDGIRELGAAIEREIRQRLLPEAIATYETGQVLNFGEINVTAQGLMLESEQQPLPWERCGAIDYYNGYSFTIQDKATASTWQKIEVASMLNFCVFLPLVTHIQVSLHARAHERDGITIRETVEEGAARGREANDSFQEPSMQEEELERGRRAHEEILEHLRSRPRATPIPQEVVKALRVLDLSSDVSVDVIRQRYRQLVKHDHPDTGGDPEVFKRINAAYRCVIAWITSQDREW
ncbi:MAG: J domain-containing protein [Ktedonobacteraceae bacterium]|nr:J domain-containing protein [Ktedonobacteraceae bacterium]